MVTTLALEQEMAFAHRLADAAAGVSLSYFQRELRGWSKADGSLATEADLAVEDGLRALLADERPDDAVLGEERGQTGTSRRRWIVDGIDGTVEFAAGTADWGTLIALEIDGEVVVGICDEPAHRRRYWAGRGHGAFHTKPGRVAPTILQVSDHANLRGARSYLPPPKWLPDDRARAVAGALREATTPLPHDDHPALQVALGGYELVVFLIAGPWDLAAPSLIVEEAGGRFSDLRGRHQLTSGNAVFSNGLVHESAVQHVAHLMGDAS